MNSFIENLYHFVRIADGEELDSDTCKQTTQYYPSYFICKKNELSDRNEKEKCREKKKTFFFMIV